MISQVYILISALVLTVFAISFYIYRRYWRGYREDVPVLASMLTASSNELLKLKVERVVDGDSITVSYSGNNVNVRLYAIDSPEDGQGGGDEAAYKLRKLLQSNERYVYLETHGIDHNGRLLATAYIVHSNNLINVNELMILSGQAWFYKEYSDKLQKHKQIQLNQLEKWARKKRIGLWSSKNPIPPWEWRNDIAVKKVA